MRHLLGLLAVIVLLVSIRASAQTPSTFATLPTNASPATTSYLMLEANSQLTKSTVAAVVNAELAVLPTPSPTASPIPNAPSPEPSCVISSGACTVDVPITGAAVVHECVGMTDENDTNGPFIVEGAPSPGPSASPGWEFTVTQVTPTSTPTVHIHAVCR